MRSVRPTLLALATLTSLATAATAATAQTPEPRLTVPAGLKVHYFAQGLRGVRFMVNGPDGAVYASQPGGRTFPGRVVRLADTNNDGVADDTSTVIADDTTAGGVRLRQPHGLAFHGGWLYIANTDGVVRVRLGAGGKATGRPEKLLSVPGPGGHSTRTVIFGPDSAMYVSVGSSCNICIEADSARATVLRYDQDGKNGRIFSRGLRNAVGLAVNPRTRRIWATTHERDNLLPEHQDLPPEEIDILEDGGDYGWPYCYSAGGKAVANPDPSGGRPGSPDPAYDPARCPRTKTADLEMQAHSAPLGITFLDRATQLPADLRGDALVAFHGSWNRDVPTGAKVVRVRVRDGRPASYEDFITGWQVANATRWGRPVDVLVYKDGSLLVSDDQGGNIYRVARAR